MVAIRQLNRTGIFQSNAELVKYCGLVNEEYTCSGDYSVLQKIIFNHYSIEDLFAMGLEETSDIKLNTLYQK